MKLIIVLAILLVFLSGCSTKTTHIVSGVQDLLLNQEDLQQLGLGVGSDCQADDAYSNVIDSSIGQYSMCNYSINSLESTEVWVELQKFANKEALEGSYQYSSSHLFSVEGLISEDVYGDKSRFRMNNVHDYMGELNEPGVYYYHLWICKDLYLIHVTSGGRSQDAKDYVVKTGQQILTKF